MTPPVVPQLSSPGSPTALGIGWRPELALFIERRSDLSFVEILAENGKPVEYGDRLFKIKR